MRDEIYTIIALIISVIAIIQTRKQIQLTKKEVFGDKRMEVFFSCQKIINFYETNASIFNKEVLNMEEAYKAIIFHFDIKEEKEIDFLKENIDQIPFLYKGSYVNYLQNFLYLLLFFIKKVYFTHLFLEKIDYLKEIDEQTQKKLKEYFISNSFLIWWTYTELDLLKAYNLIQKKKVLKKLKKQIKFF